MTTSTAVSELLVGDRILVGPAAATPVEVIEVATFNLGGRGGVPTDTGGDWPCSRILVRTDTGSTYGIARFPRETVARVTT